MSGAEGMLLHGVVLGFAAVALLWSLPATSAEAPTNTARALPAILDLLLAGDSSSPDESPLPPQPTSLAAISLPHLANADAGSLPGELKTSNGAAVYSLPLALPPGSGAMTPSLGLEYNSQAGNGPVGLGWSLAGFSSIQRCEKTLAQDGSAGRVTFTQSDRLCLDGQRLVRVNGADVSLSDDAGKDAAYWAVDAEYRTEVETFQRITRFSANGRVGFKVETKAGQTLYYGIDGLDGKAASYVLAQGRSDGQAASWSLDRREDVSGNRVTYEYVLNTARGEHYPRQVRYGAHATAGVTADLIVRFGFIGRSDEQTGYFGGSKVELSQLLRTVTMAIDTAADGTGGTRVGTYTLTYGQSGSTGRSLLRQVELCTPGATAGAADICLPKTIFTWGEETAPQFVLAEEVPNVSYASAGRTDTPTVSWSWSMERPMTLEAPAKANWISFEKKYWCEVCTGVDREFLSERTGRYRVALNDGRVIEGADTRLANPEVVNGLLNQIMPINLDGGDANGLLVYSDRIGGVAGYTFDGLFNKVVEKYCATSIRGGQFFVDSCTPVTSLLAKDGYTKVYLSDFDFLGRGKPNFRRVKPDGSAQLCVLNEGVADCQTSKTLVDRTPDVLPQVARGKMFDQFAPINFNRGEITDLFSASFANMSAAVNTYDRLGATRVCISAAQVECEIVKYDFTLLNSGNGTLGEYRPAESVGDLNGDGIADFVFFDGQSKTYVCLGTERSADCFVAGEGWGSYNRAGSGKTILTSLGDFRGTGQTALLVRKWDVGVDRLQLCTLSFRTLNCSDVSGGIPGIAGLEYYRVSIVADARNGLPTVQVRTSGTTSKEAHKRYTLARTPGLDRIVAVQDGWGRRDDVVYGRPDDAELYRRQATDPAGIAMPLPRHPSQYATPGSLVRRIERGNGVGDRRVTTFRYEQMLRDALGRKGLGFAKQVATDPQTGIATTTYQSQAWPTLGMPLRTMVQAANNTVLSDTQADAQAYANIHPNAARSWFVYSGRQLVERRDLDGSALGSTLSCIDYGLAAGGLSWGNVRQSLALVAPQKATVDITCAQAVSLGGAWKTRTDTTYKSAAASSAPWLQGLVDTVTVIRSSPTETAAARVVQYGYESNGLLKTEVRQPADTAYKLTTSYDRSGNAFGLVNKKTLSWRDPASNTDQTRVVEDVAYDTKGRFPTVVKNALGQAETRAYDPKTGVQTSLAGPNGLVTTWAVNGFGRKTGETRSDGTETRYYLEQCDAGCPAGAASVEIADHFKGVDRIAVPTLSYRDNAGHVLRSQSYGFDGRTIMADQRYDSRGRPWEVDQPRYGGDAAVLASRQGYDALDRVTSIVTPDEAGTERSVTTQYKGLVTIQTNAKSYTKTDERNVLGLLVKSTDALTKATLFGRDPWGNLNQTTDPNGNVIKVAYDVLGRKTELQDPDLGTIRYEVDPLGQVWKQVSPKQKAAGQSTKFEFDALGRMTARYEPDLESHWIYDHATTPASCASTKSCGQLVESHTGTSTAKDYRQTQTYDSLGRPYVTTRYLDVSYIDVLAYDNWGRLAKRSLQRGSASAKVYDNRYNALGYLARIERGGFALWQANAQDAANRVTQASLGNGLSIDTIYNPETGRLTGDLLKTAAGAPRIQEGYQYDALGNVTQRSQYWNGSTGFTELFDYDALNRLKQSQVTGKTLLSFTYDAIGNLLSKTGTGTGTGAYAYPTQGATAIRPHAVQSIPGIGTFTYDENGNLTSGASRTLTWTSFDMPKRITEGSVWSEFTYGPDHQRTKQQKQDGSTVYYAGGQEVENKAGVLTVKTYWPQGLGVEIDVVNGSTTTTLNWTHLDRLGSVIAITDLSGNLKEMLAYDAWGKRRSLDGATTLDTLDGVVDNKGFTGHEMMDGLDLVHMNGRVYDPLVARFISADPIIQEPDWGQSYNRYTYVWNNPTNLIDPTGYEVGVSRLEVVGSRRLGSNVVCQGSGCAGLLQAWSNELNRQGTRSLQAARGAMTGMALRAFVYAGAVVMIAIAPSNFNQDACHGGALCRIDPVTGELSEAAYRQYVMQQATAKKEDDADTVSEDKPSLLDDKGDKHILDGDGPNKGGGHRAGTGKPGKSEFPSNWTDDKIRGEISDVATDPNSVQTPQQGGRIKVQGTRDGIDITVIVEPGSKGGRIVTGFPTNTPRNP